MIRLQTLRVTHYKYVMDHKKPIVPMPSNIPPKYIYQTKYHPNAIPTLQMGLPDHVHLNEFDTKAFSDFQLFRFRYTGEWWHKGGMISKLMVFLLPIWGWYEITRVEAAKVKNGRPGIFNTTSFVDIAGRQCIPKFEL